MLARFPKRSRPLAKKGSSLPNRSTLFIYKVRDIVGLYLNPPDKAVVLCVDGKTGIRTRRPHPADPAMRPGQVERRTHNLQTQRVIDLFAAGTSSAAKSSAISATTPRGRVPQVSHHHRPVLDHRRVELGDEAGEATEHTVVRVTLEGRNDSEIWAR